MRKVCENVGVNVYMTGEPTIFPSNYRNTVTTANTTFTTEFGPFESEFLNINRNREKLIAKSNLKVRPWEDIIEVSRKHPSTHRKRTEICRFEGVILDISPNENCDISLHVAQTLIDIYDELNHVCFESFSSIYDWIMGITNTSFVPNSPFGSFNECLTTCLQNTVYDKTTNIAKAVRRCRYADHRAVHNIFYVFREMRDAVDEKVIEKER